MTSGVNKNKVALIFPGQGSQYVSMGRELYDASPKAREILDVAEGAVPGLLKVMFEGPEDCLTATGYCQPAVFTHSVAALRAFENSPAFVSFEPSFTCGHSLGEYAALVACGALDFVTGLDLVKKRAGFMEETARLSKGAMAAVIGFDAAALEKICAEHGVRPANYNAPDQIVITGEAGLIAEASRAIQTAGAKRVIQLAVSGAFHSPLMRPAADRFAREVTKVTFAVPKFPVISNVDAIPTSDPARIAENLSRQITSSVQWVKSIEAVAAAGVTDFIEIGPGKVLKGLSRKINRDLAVFNIENFADILHVS
jgi:[acyl-carrier-protein] S-malonyltransferase